MHLIVETFRKTALNTVIIKSNETFFEGINRATRTLTKNMESVKKTMDEIKKILNHTKETEKPMKRP
jgi:hypothetical protein